MSLHRVSIPNIYVPTSCTVGNLQARPIYRRATVAEETFGGLEVVGGVVVFVEECGGFCALCVAQPFGINWGGK